MPTKQEYLAQFRKTLEQKPQLTEEQLENYKSVSKEIPLGQSPKKWLKAEKESFYARKGEFMPTYQKAYDEAVELCEKKRKELLESTENKLKLIRAENKSKMEKGEYYDTREEDKYNESRMELQYSYTKGTSRTFSNGTVRWDIRMEDHEPFKALIGQKKIFDEREAELKLFEETQNAMEKNDQAVADGIKAIQNELHEKQNAFNALNGWQKFWARVLPASWYNKAQDYADLKAHEQAMAEVGIREQNLPEDEPEVEREVGEPLPEEEVNTLQKQTELNAPVRDKAEVKENAPVTENVKEIK